MPPADDTAFARSQGNSSSALLIFFVVATVPSDSAAVFDCSNPANATKSRACLGLAFHVKPERLQDKIRFTILASVPRPGPMIEITLMFTLCSNRCSTAAKRSLPPTLLARSRGKKLRFQGEADFCQGHLAQIWWTVILGAGFLLVVYTLRISST